MKRIGSFALKKYCNDLFKRENRIDGMCLTRQPTKKSAPADLESIVIPNHTWAVFTIEGDWDKVDDTWCRVYSEWFPSSGYEPAYAAEFMISRENYSEIWVAIKEHKDFK